LNKKTELTKGQVEEQIKLKKEKIGAGYLTDQGALFLIASDYGVTLSEPLKVENEFKRSICRSKGNFIRNKSSKFISSKTIFKKRWISILSQNYDGI
jgi:hypothetical protein